MTDVTDTVTIAAVEARLVALGNHHDAVAATLLAAGIRGRRESVTACPVARYLDDMQGVDRVHALPMQCVIYTADAALIVDTPPPVGRFMSLFDVGRYDALVEDTSERAA